MARERRRQIKRERSPGAALGESVPSTPHVGPRLDGGGHAHGHDGDDEQSNATLGQVGADDDQSSRFQSAEEVLDADEDRAVRASHTRSVDVQTESRSEPPLILPTTQVTVNVGGRLFTAHASTLCKEPSLLSLDVRSYFQHTLKDENGIPFYDRDPDNFSHILNYLRGYPLMLNAEEARHLAQDALYFDIKGLRQATGADPSLIKWQFQPGPGVSSDGKRFHSTEIVSLIGAGPLLPSETSVVFFRIEKHSQLAIGLVPPNIPLDQHFGKLPNTICYESTGEVSCSIISYPSQGVPDALADVIPKMLVHDLTMIIGAGNAALRACGLDAAVEGMSAGPSPSLLAVSNTRSSQGNDNDTETYQAPRSFNLTNAPVLTAEATSLWRSGAVQRDRREREAIGVASPFIRPQQQPLRPMRTNGSLQPSMLPSMPSPLVRGFGPSPTLGPISHPNTPHLLPTTSDGRPEAAPPPRGGLTPLSANELQTGISQHSLLDRLPMLCSNVCATSASVPRIKEGDEMCVVSHLSEDGSVVIVRFYRGEQLLHVVVGFGGCSNRLPAGLNEDTPTRIEPLPPLQLALFARSATTVITSDSRSTKRDPQNANRGGQRQSLPAPISAPPPQLVPPEQRSSGNPTVVPTTPLAVITSALQEQQFRSHEAQFHSLLHLFPEMVGRIAATVGSGPQERGGSLNHVEVLGLLLHTIAEAVRQLVQVYSSLSSSGLFEYFLALPRFYNVPVFDEDYLVRLLASPQNTSTSSAMLFPLSNNIQSILVTAVRSIALSDNDISAMARRQNSSAMSTLEQLESKRQGALSAVASLLNNRRSFSTGSPLSITRVQELVHLLLPETHLFWDRLGPPPRNPPHPVASGEFIAFRSAREMLDD